VEKVEKTEYRFTYKDIPCEIVFWTTDRMKEDEHGIYVNKGIWNSYITIKKEKFGDRFKEFNLRPKTQTLASGTKYVIFPNSYKLAEMDGGITYYEKIYDQKGKLWGVKIGNDYNHIWNGGESFELIKSDLEKSVDSLVKELSK
jgi:hypothetical protein